MSTSCLADFKKIKRLGRGTDADVHYGQKRLFFYNFIYLIFLKKSNLINTLHFDSLSDYDNDDDMSDSITNWFYQYADKNIERGVKRRKEKEEKQRAQKKREEKEKREKEREEKEKKDLEEMEKKINNNIKEIAKEEKERKNRKREERKGRKRRNGRIVLWRIRFESFTSI
jgi:hypothetical protein